MIIPQESQNKPETCKEHFQTQTYLKRLTIIKSFPRQSTKSTKDGFDTHPLGSKALNKH